MMLLNIYVHLPVEIKSTHNRSIKSGPTSVENEIPTEETVEDLNVVGEGSIKKIIRRKLSCHGSIIDISLYPSKLSA